MRYIAFTVFPRYFCYVPRSVLFGRFVEQMRERPPAWWPSSSAVGTKCLPPAVGLGSESGPILGALANGSWNSSIHAAVATPWWPSNNAPLQRSAHNCEFQKLGAGWEVGEFRYQPHPGKRPHRLVVVRRPIPQDPVEAGQLTLFKDNKYADYVLVTNLRAHPWRGWRFYAPHATIEKDVGELLYDYPLGKIPTDDGVANVAFFQLLLFAL